MDNSFMFRLDLLEFKEESLKLKAELNRNKMDIDSVFSNNKYRLFIKSGA